MPTPIVDANVHAVVPSVTALLPYLPAFWREQVATTAFRGAPESAWPPGMPMSRHPDARIPASGPPGSDLALLREQVLDLPGIESAVLQCAYAIESIRNPDGAAAVAAAVNDWLVAEWLEPEPRLRASMVVPSHTPGAAVAEIERVGDHPGFVQVFLPIRSAMPYGRREYHPLHAAAAERGLVVGLGYGGLTGNAPTGVGWPTYLVEEFVGMAAVAQSQLMSLVVHHRPGRRAGRGPAPRPRRHVGRRTAALRLGLPARRRRGSAGSGPGPLHRRGGDGDAVRHRARALRARVTGGCAVTALEERPAAPARTTWIDCDVHIAMPSPAALRENLPEEWRERHDRYGGNPFHASLYPRMALGAARTDAWPPDGSAPGSSLPFLREQLLDRWAIEYAVLGPIVRPDQAGMRNPGYAAALARATNDWVVREWLDPDPRLRSSIVVPVEDTEYAVAEIERVAGDPRFVQVYLQIKTSAPLGNRRYWPIYEAAAAHDLPVGIHFGGVGGHPSTAAGWASYYLEDHAGNAQTFQHQLVSLVCSGVLERLPDLRIVIIEGGVAWAPALVWRLDAAFERMHDEVPHLTRRPSEYVADHVWFTTQPVEEPPDPRSLARVFDDLPCLRDRVMYSSDYPHWDFDAPDQVLRTVPLDAALRAKIMTGNARELYRLPR
ncbi:amidohydrolase family protein [Pseudonocardia sp. D17]|uniref:amidohydrolase family protein n=1 Tax=Pseudonocardia sp. D17 TaxID=882661 RepID=UPI002B36EA5C|nr:hypothetical protein PSD17_14780 [Pseudonocardia sp. D17]